MIETTGNMEKARAATSAGHSGGRLRSRALLEIVKVTMGIVKWFNPEKGYGFIRPDDGSGDVFVHISAVQKAGHTTLAEGARVSYELLPGRSGKISAENLRVG